MADKNKEVGSICTYRVDASDHIFSVGKNWQTFAEENDAPDACFAPQVIGSSIWDHIKDLETHHLYKILVAKVRQTQKSVTLPLRCDAPDLKRYLEITLLPDLEDGVTFQSKTVRVKPRPSTDLLDVCVARSNELVRICSFCKKIDLGEDQWVETEVAVARKGIFNHTPPTMSVHKISCRICDMVVMIRIVPFIESNGQRNQSCKRCSCQKQI